MSRSAIIFFVVLAVISAHGTAQATVRVEPIDFQGPRPLEEKTQAEAIREYLKAWKTASAALEQNSIDLLDRDFVGTARDELAQAIQEQAALGDHTLYQDKSHDIQIIFYSPEGLSIELTDNVQYDIQFVAHDKVQIARPVQARYVVVSTPTEMRWKVRVLQAQRE